jgi:hypothetical protein
VANAVHKQTHKRDQASHEEGERNELEALCDAKDQRAVRAFAQQGVEGHGLYRELYNRRCANDLSTLFAYSHSMCLDMRVQRVTDGLVHSDPKPIECQPQWFAIPSHSILIHARRERNGANMKRRRSRNSWS